MCRFWNEEFDATIENDVVTVVLRQTGAPVAALPLTKSPLFKEALVSILDLYYNGTVEKTSETTSVETVSVKQTSAKRKTSKVKKNEL